MVSFSGHALRTDKSSELYFQAHLLATCKLFGIQKHEPVLQLNSKTDYARGFSLHCAKDEIAANKRAARTCAFIQNKATVGPWLNRTLAEYTESTV